MHRVRMLIHFGVIPYLVFDGDYLPSKAATEDERWKRRDESKKLGLRLFHAGKVSQAQSELQKAVDVTPEMAKQLINELKRHSIKYVVAPYEADAQLAYLEREGVIEGIISEDSDLLVFGAKRLLTKLDQYGECVEINRRDFTACKELSLVGWTDDQFRQMAILSGCDYLASINNMGLKTAYRLIRKYKKAEKVVQVLQFDSKFRVPNGYFENFRKAEMTFLHQRVFDPSVKEIVMATEPESNEFEDMDFIGKHIDRHIGIAVAAGDLDPMTKQPLVCKVSALKNSPSPWRNGRKENASAVSTPDSLKPSKPINSFFKPRRVPLAELDPNSFTPSPSQRRLQEVQGNTWFISPLADSPHPPALVSSASLPNLSRSATERSASISSSCPPPKRLRLCEDPFPSEKDVTSAAETKSRFFGSARQDSSPCVTRKKKAKDVDFQIRSHDSVGDAMLELPTVDGFEARRKSRVSVFCEEDQTKCVEDGKEFLENTQVTATASTITSFAFSTQDPAAELASQTTASSSRNSTNSGEGMKGLLKGFEHQPEGATVDRASKLLQRTSVHFANISNSANSRSKVQKPDFERKAPPSRLPRPKAISAGPVSVKTSAKAVKSSKAGDSLGGSDCVPESPENITKVKIIGSEDCLIPNSEDEHDHGTESEEEKLIEQPMVNLGRFLYSTVKE